MAVVLRAAVSDHPRVGVAAGQLVEVKVFDFAEKIGLVVAS
jgi:hypothetical protein